MEYEGVLEEPQLGLTGGGAPSSHVDMLFLLALYYSQIIFG
jgi:membrane-associated phospholipid phosphatase